MVAKGAAAIDAAMLEITLKAHISEMRDRPKRRSVSPKRPARADAGNIRKAIEIALDIEQLTYEVNTLLNAASLRHRISRD